MKEIIELVEPHIGYLSHHDRSIAGFVLNMKSNGNWCWAEERCTIGEIEDYLDNGIKSPALIQFKKRIEDNMSTVFVTPISGSGLTIGYLKSEDGVEYLPFTETFGPDSFKLRDMTEGKIIDYNN